MSGVWGEVQEFFSEERMTEIKKLKKLKIEEKKKIKELKEQMKTKKEVSDYRIFIKFLKLKISKAIRKADNNSQKWFSLKIPDDPILFFFLSCMVKYDGYSLVNGCVVLHVLSPGTMIDEWKFIFTPNYRVTTGFNSSIFIWLKLLEGRKDPFHDDDGNHHLWKMNIMNTKSTLGTMVYFTKEESECVTRNVLDMSFPRETIESRIAEVDKYIQKMLNAE